MKNPKVNYKIKKENSVNPIDITVDLSEIEKGGLEEYLIQSGHNEAGDEFEIISRFIILPPKKTFDKKPINSLENNVRNISIRDNFDKKEYLYRVHLHSVEYYKNTPGFPKYVDLKAQTRGKAILIAQNKVGFTDFPEGWNNMKVESGENIDDYGIYQLGDENNVYKQREKSYNH